MSRLLGIDAGSKKIGLALSDSLYKTASPLKVIKNDENFEKKLLSIIDEYKVEKVIIGIPYNLKGEKGQQAKSVENFIENRLRWILEKKNIKLVEMDERFTSKISDRIIAEKETASKISKNHKTKFKKIRKKDFSENDSIAAAVLLTDYIERKRIIDKQ
jgi:putative Holliday junction resolvase